MNTLHLLILKGDNYYWFLQIRFSLFKIPFMCRHKDTGHLVGETCPKVKLIVPPITTTGERSRNPIKLQCQPT